MKLQDIWKKYEQDIEFNFSVLPAKIRQAGKEVHFFPQDIIVSGGDRLKYIFLFNPVKPSDRENMRTERNTPIFTLTAEAEISVF